LHLLFDFLKFIFGDDAVIGSPMSLLTNDNDNTSNPKRFWSFIKGKRTESTGVAPLRREGILHSDTATKGNILNDQFTSVFSSEQGEDIPTKGNSP
jgi:hypothetical protein